MDEASSPVRPTNQRSRSGYIGPGTTVSGVTGDVSHLLSGISVFKDVPPVHLEQLMQASRLREVLHGTKVLMQGEPADGVYAILTGEGRVRIEWADLRSKRMMVHLLRCGDIFGELAILNESTRTANAVVEGRVGLLQLDPRVFLEVLLKSATLGSNISRLLAQRLCRTFELCRDSTFQSLEARFARQILYLAAAEERRSDCALRVPGQFRQADLADLLGVTTRSIINILNKWRREGIVKYDAGTARLTICCEEKLSALLNT